MLDGTYRFGQFSLSPRERRLFRGDKSVPLPPKAFDAVNLLVRNHGNLVKREEIFSNLWPDVHVSEANLTNIIVLLRKVLGRGVIQTVSKFGYRFTPPVTGEPGIRPEAYASFVRGKELLAERSSDAALRARDLFWLCLAKDPQFAPAWAWLGRAYRLIEKFHGQPYVDGLAEAAFDRAFLLDPDLACAHQFFTQLQVDAGDALQAMTRLATRLKTRGDDPESLAGLVQVLRCCGLLDASITAHERAVRLDPSVKTSVAHTHFLRGDFAKVFETYTGALFYLDAAAWAALGAANRACGMLRQRLAEPQLGTVMATLMGSLLAVLEDDGRKAVELIRAAKIDREPEAIFYLARHCAMAAAAEPAFELLERARKGGFWSSCALDGDPAFAGIRTLSKFSDEIREAQRLESKAEEAFRKALGAPFGSCSA
jgi:DNA-binding winged helix-turn-helix (wHTH) protein/tetratricopeptide (TPR) repeat protein